MKTTFERVKEFHEAFSHPVAGSPMQLSPELVRLRLSLIIEECTELLEACVGESVSKMTHLNNLQNLLARLRDQSLPTNEEIDLVEVADALGDIDYVVAGAAHCWGIPLDDVGEEVHRSNMSKLDENGKPIYRLCTDRDWETT